MASVVSVHPIVSELRRVRVRIVPDSHDELIRDRIPSLLAVARRLLGEQEARAVVDEAVEMARDLMLEFRAPSPGVWLQGLVVGLSVAHSARARDAKT